MTPAEAYAELGRDWDELIKEHYRFIANGGWKNARRPNAHYPMSIMHEYMTKTNNRYLLANNIISRQEAVMGTTSLFVRALVNTEEGLCAYSQQFDKNGKHVLFVFRPHLFKRYRERMALKDNQDPIRTFFKRNSFYLLEEDYRRSKGNTNDLMFTVQDGAVFGRADYSEEVGFVEMKTFVANDTMQDGYKSRFNEGYNDSMRDIALHAQGDRKLEHIVSHTGVLRKEKK
jgi:hypothetical protein